MDLRRTSLFLTFLLGGSMQAWGGFSGAPPTCASGSFNSYTQQTLCTVGILGLYNFELYTLDASNNRTVASTGLLNTITVDPVWNAGTGVMTMTIGGFTGFDVGPTATAGWLIRFTVDPPPVVAGEDVGFDPPFGPVFGHQSYCPDGLFNTAGICSSGVAPSASFSIGNPAFLRFTPALATLDTLTSIRLNPNLDTAAGFDGVVFTVSTTPEPASWMLMPAALAIAGWGKRRRR